MFDFLRRRLIVLIVILYIALTYFSLRRSSEPVKPCHGGQQRCVRPLLPADAELSLELWIYGEVPQEQNQTGLRYRQHYRWMPVKSCSHGMVFGLADSKTLFDATNGNCTLELPDFARRRGDPEGGKQQDDGGEPLGAKFIVRSLHEGQPRGIVAEAPFELTRMVKRTTGAGSSIWNFNSDNAPAKERRKLIDPYTTAENVNVSDAEQVESEDFPTPHGTTLVPHFKYRGESIVLRLVADDQEYGLPPYRGDGVLLHVDQSDRRSYRPIVYVDDVALRHSSQIELAKSGKDKPPLNLRIKVSVISPMRDVVNMQVRMGMEMAESMLHESELDEIRYLISDDHLWRFLLTQIISFLHIWLDYLAFRDEVGFYVGKTDMGGLSVSSVVTRFFCSLIIFLYLLEGGGTSMLVLVSVGSGLAAEGWKAWKILKPGLSPVFPFVTIRDPSRLSTTEKQSRGFDRIATTYLSLILYPMIAGSALYALHYYVYASWWSWLISNLANAVYTFGFIALCPQLYINYRLKSVAHIPWKPFMYKLFNTFVDDVFAFLIEMPLKHKLMTLRDDVVFIVFLYQARIYRVDKSRPNEFGFAYDKDDDSVREEKEGKEKESCEREAQVGMEKATCTENGTVACEKRKLA